MTIAPAVMLAVLSLPGQAADWPVRPVTVIVPLAAGGNTDMMARLAAQHLTDKLGQTFIVENRPSAGGAIATAQVAAAPPDGYTLLFTPSSMLLLTPLLQKLSFDPGKQLVPVTNVGTGAQVIAIKRELPARTLPEFLAYARGHPGTLNFAVAGTQNISHLAPVLLFARAGVNLVMVPAKGEAQAIADLISGQVDLYFGNASQLLPHAGSDRIRLLAVGTAQRIAAAPDLPTVAETFPGLVFSSWNGFVVAGRDARRDRRCAPARDHRLVEVTRSGTTPDQARDCSRRPKQGGGRRHVCIGSRDVCCGREGSGHCLALMPEGGIA